ncbi:hypothetical protein DFP73DRAFT_582887 [Morchella snyderi]|nr:hypothetical protein DFP73DRAFT_582887 [Morchella snyderi]
MYHGVEEARMIHPDNPKTGKRQSGDCAHPPVNTCMNLVLVRVDSRALISGQFTSPSPTHQHPALISQTPTATLCATKIPPLEIRHGEYDCISTLDGDACDLGGVLGYWALLEEVRSDGSEARESASGNGTRASYGNPHSDAGGCPLRMTELSITPIYM